MTDTEQRPAYFLRSMGKITGPFDIERLKRLHARGQFGPASEVSTDKRHWRPWSSLDDFSPRSSKSSQEQIGLKPAAVVEPQAAPAAEPESSPAAATWYYAGESGSMGPVNRNDLLLLVSHGALSPSSLVWQEGMRDWQAIEDVPDLARSIPGNNGKGTSVGGRPSQQFRYSNFWRRVAAAQFDLVILGVICQGLVILISMYLLPGEVPWQQIYLVSIAAQLLMNWLYHAALESSQLQGTFGKLAMELKVSNLSGQRIGFGRASGRYFGKLLSFLILGIGFLMIAFTEKRQGLHDMLADCLVLDQES